MKFGDFIKTTKGKIVTFGGVSVVAVGVAVAMILQGGGYRSILVKQVEGTVDVVGERNNGQAYVGERLYSGDDVSVREASSLTMCMDNDKYLYADANTHFKLEASPKRQDSRIKIYLDKGSELNELKSKLGVNDTYEVDTPNSTMSVRGTIFRVTVYTGSDGLTYTLLEVKEGVVLVKLKTVDGIYNGIEKEFVFDESALIRGNNDFSEFVEGDDGEVERRLDYKSLPDDSVERLKALLKEDKNTDDEKGETEKKDNEKKSEKDTSETESSDEELNTEEKTEKDDSLKKNTEEKKTEADKTQESTNTKKTAEKRDKNSKATDKKSKNSKTSTTDSQDTKTDDKDSQDTKTSDKDSQSNKSEDKNTQSTQAEEKNTEHVHTPGDWEVVKEATCITDGNKQRKCTSCGEVVDNETIPATGHEWSNWTTTKEATCMIDGSKKRTCSRCGESETSKIAALGHDWVKHTSEQTTGPDGLPYTWYECSRCRAQKN